MTVECKARNAALKYVAATKLSPCISYSNCSDEDGYCNPYTNTEKAYSEEEECVEMKNAEETDLEDDVDEKRGVHEDVEVGFVDPYYMDNEWELINDYY